jgi:hypothetical protein
LIFDTLLWAWGAETQQALKSVKGPGNTFDLNPKWARTLPSLIYFSCDIYRDPSSTKKIQISKLIFDTLLWAWGAETHQALMSVKGPGNTFDLNPKWTRTLPSLIYSSDWSSVECSLLPSVVFWLVFCRV